MPFAHARNGKLFAWDSSGTCRDISGDLNNITLAWNRDNPETTTLGKDTIQRMAGLRDVTLTGAAVWNSDSGSGAWDVLDDLMSGSIVTLLKYVPGASITGCPMLTGCFLISALGLAGPVNAPTGLTFSFQIASGSLSASTV